MARTAYSEQEGIKQQRNLVSDLAKRWYK